MTYIPSLILAIPGSQETQELPLPAIREALARGEIEPTCWAWCQKQQDWKPVSELMELNAASVEMPPHETVSTVPTSQFQTDYVVKEKSGFGSFKLLFILLSLLLAGIVGANYLCIDKPFCDKLAGTSFDTAPAHAHLGAFVQLDTIVIHLRPTSAVTTDNLADYLVALACSTPPRPFSDKAFSAIGLTSAWRSQFMMTGEDWRDLAKLAQASEIEKKDFILSHLGYPSGERLLLASQITDPDALQKRREKAWNGLVSVLLPRGQ